MYYNLGSIARSVFFLCSNLRYFKDVLAMWNGESWVHSLCCVVGKGNISLLL